MAGDETRCNACGKELPAPEVAAPVATASPDERHCPRCGIKVPRYVLRCRDCGAYMDPGVEAAALAKQMSRSFAPAGAGVGFPRGFAGPTGGASGSGFAEVADDADFDLNPSVDMLAGIPSLSPSDGSSEPPQELQDDFDLQQESGVDEYAVAAPGEPPASPGETTPAEKPFEAGSGEAAAEANLPHSVQTGGDVLLDAAMQEERDALERGRGGRRRLKRSVATALPPGRFLVFCPNGHRIQVHDKHRGRTGRCPNCRALFVVPQADAQAESGATAEAAAAPASEPAPAAIAGYGRWISDVRLHRLNPAKLKLRPGSLSAEFDPVDIGASSENLLLAVLFTGGGPFRAMQEPKKKVQTRQQMLDHLAKQLPVADLPTPRHYVLTPEQLQMVKIVHPTIAGEESLFADVPVFGEGRIALRVPAADSAGERAFLSLTLSQFRSFSQILAEIYSLADFGAGTSIPLTDNLQEAVCHYSEAPLRFLPQDSLAWYRSDPAITLTVVGRKCEKCGLIVSEDSRKKEKIGSKSEASIAKARCPKCKQKFGSITLYGLASASS